MFQTLYKRAFISSSFHSIRFFSSSSFESHGFLQTLGISESNQGVFDGEWCGSGGSMNQINPCTNGNICEVTLGNVGDYERAVGKMYETKKAWAETPAPIRGEVVRRIGEKLREKKVDLGGLISLEMGKIRAEGEGEVQEAIDICDFAVGLSRQLNGKVIPSERPHHIMLERWNPLNRHVGIITAFNFPVAVFFWNLALSMVCGNTNLWKPAPSVNSTSIATMKIVQDVISDCLEDGTIEK